MDDETRQLFWCLLPQWDLQFERPRGRSTMKAIVRSRILPNVYRPRPEPMFWEFLDGLVVTRSANEFRTVDGVFDGKATTLARSGERLPAERTAQRSRAARTVARWCRTFLAAHDRPDLLGSWLNDVSVASLQLREYRSLDLRDYRYVLVMNPANYSTRALTLAAEEQSVPVAYLPHSPLTRRHAADYPFQVAALRGDAERRFTAETFGTDPGRLHVVGNTGTDILRLPMPAISASARGVLAVSPDQPIVIEQIFRMLSAGGLTDLVVAPHPRSDVTELRRLLPAGWSLASVGSTMDLLRAGPAFVIQYSSGVAWEAAALGIPTAEIRLGDRVPDYPFLEDDSVFPALSEPADVRSFVQGAASRSREALRAYAEAWCSVDGATAVDRTREYFAAIEGSRTDRILDAWDPETGDVFASSPLTAGMR